MATGKLTTVKNTVLLVLITHICFRKEEKDKRYAAIKVEVSDL